MGFSLFFYTALEKSEFRLQYIGVYGENGFHERIHIPKQKAPEGGGLCSQYSQTLHSVY